MTASLHLSAQYDQAHRAGHGFWPTTKSRTQMHHRQVDRELRSYQRPSLAANRCRSISSCRICPVAWHNGLHPRAGSPRCRAITALDRVRTEFLVAAHDFPLGTEADGVISLDFFRGYILNPRLHPRTHHIAARRWRQFMALSRRCRVHFPLCTHNQFTSHVVPPQRLRSRIAIEVLWAANLTSAPMILPGLRRNLGLSPP